MTSLDVLACHPVSLTELDRFAGRPVLLAAATSAGAVGIDVAVTRTGATHTRAIRATARGARVPCTGVILGRLIGCRRGILNVAGRTRRLDAVARPT